MPFYSIQLADTPEQEVVVLRTHKIQCVYGLVQSWRWQEAEALIAIIIELLAMVIEYNLFIDRVNRFEHLCAAQSNARKIQRVPILVLTFLIDVTIQNEYDLRKDVIDPTETVQQLREFKQHFWEAMLELLLLQNTGWAVILNTGRKDGLFGAVANAKKGASEPITNGADHMLLFSPCTDRKKFFLCRPRLVKNSHVRCWYACGVCSLPFYIDFSPLFTMEKELQTFEAYSVLTALEKDHTRTSLHQRIRRASCTDQLPTLCLLHRQGLPQKSFCARGRIDGGCMEFQYELPVVPLHWSILRKPA